MRMKSSKWQKIWPAHSIWHKPAIALAKKNLTLPFNAHSNSLKKSKGHNLSTWQLLTFQSTNPTTRIFSTTVWHSNHSLDHLLLLDRLSVLWLKVVRVYQALFTMLLTPQIKIAQQPQQRFAQKIRKINLSIVWVDHNFLTSSKTMRILQHPQSKRDFTKK